MIAHNNQEKVVPLKKLRLSIGTGANLEASDITFQPFEFEFIMGIGSNGLTPFEFQLMDKYEGDEISLRFNVEQLHEMFGHLHINLPFRHSSNASNLSLQIKILLVMSAENRDIVKAMAESAACQGCCGNH